MGEPRVNLVLAILRAAPGLGRRSATPSPACARPWASSTSTPPRGRDVDVFEAQARGLVEQMEKAGWDPAAAARPARRPRGPAGAGLRRRPRSCPGWRGTTDELTAVLHALDGGFVPAGPSGSPLRGLVNVLPTGRNFYTVDPRAVPSRLAWQTGQAMADSLVQRYLDETGDYPASVGLSVWGTSAMRTSGDDIAEVLALLGVRPEWDAASRRVRELTVVPLDGARPSAHRRDRAHLRLLPRRLPARGRDARRRGADGGRARGAGRGQLRAARTPAPTSPSTATSGARRRASSAPSPGRTAPASCRSSSRARGATTTTSPRSTRPGAASPTAATSTAPRRPTTCAPTTAGSRWRPRTSTAVEHDIADSDDYFQYHGGMIATVRALTGAEPKAYVGDSTSPDAVRTRTLAEETARVFRSRVVNPRWIAAMQRHGYKGAFELAATVDYLFGFDATAGVVHDWMYEKLAHRVRPRRDQPGVPAYVEPVGAARDRRAAPRGRRPRAVGVARPGRDGRDAAGLPRGRGRPRGPDDRRREDPGRRRRAWGRSTSPRRPPRRSGPATT